MTTQVAVAVAAVAAVAVVDNEDSVQWWQWGGRSMVEVSFDGGHATISRGTMRGREGSAMRGQEWRNKRQHNKPASARQRDGGAVRERQKGQDGNATTTRGDTTTRRCDETTRGWRSERMTREQECGATRRGDGSTTSGKATTTNLRNQTMRGRCIEKTMRGKARI